MSIADDQTLDESEQDELQQQQEDGASAETAQAEESADDELEVTIGDQPATQEPDDSKAPTWVRELRKTNAELVRAQRRLEDENKRLKAASAPAAVVVGPEPTLEGCNYDGDKFKAEYKAWVERQSQADAQARDESKRQEEANRSWQTKKSSYETAKAGLKVRDFAAAEDVVVSAFSELQQNMLLAGAQKPELLVYALGKNPGKARELAAIKDPVQFCFALARLETQLKVAPRKPSVGAETIPRGGSAGAAGAAAVDSQLEKLREEAMKTGDLSKVMEFKRQLKAKQA